MKKTKVLILCTGNSCRSQMAEGWLRHLGGERFEAASAGIRPSHVHPMAIAAMREAGVDIREQRSKSVEEFEGQQMDLVITVCDSAKEACPVFPGAPRRMHWPFFDPAAAQGDDAQRMRVFREVRDEIRRAMEKFIAEEK